MERKVNLLISTSRQLSEDLREIGLINASNSISLACNHLHSHDLTGLIIILESLSKDNIKDDINNCEIYGKVLRVIELTSDIRNDFERGVTPLTREEELFLNISYNKFFDISSEIYSSKFWRQTPKYRFGKIAQIFSIYSEILNYGPIKGVLSWISQYRPPMESEIVGSLFKFIRNILSHFPFYDSWDEIWISKELVNWRSRNHNQSIDKFIRRYTGMPSVKYRFKEKLKSDFTFVTISFPKEYDNNKIYLRDIIREEEGVKFALVMMFKVLYTQIESISERIS